MEDGAHCASQRESATRFWTWEWPVRFRFTTAREEQARCSELRRTIVDPNLLDGYVGGMDYSQLITVEPDKQSGQPFIRGLRMTVRDVREYLAGGMSME